MQCTTSTSIFVNVHTEECGLTIANKGLCEYEILRDGKNTIAITIHRGTRELGDWGVFLTPEAQCLGERSVEFAIIPHGAEKEQFKSYKLAYQYQIDWTTKTLDLNTGNIGVIYQLFETNHLEIAYSALKLSDDGKHIVSRWFNLDMQDSEFEIKTDMNICELDLLEEKVLREKVLRNLENKIKLGKKEIITIGLK